MPRLNTSEVKHRMAELRVTSKTLAEATEIDWGYLRNAIAGRDPLKLQLIYDVARVLVREGEELRTVVTEITANDDGVPDPPPDQTKPPQKPERRKEKGGSGPKREDEGAAA